MPLFVSDRTVSTLIAHYERHNLDYGRLLQRLLLALLNCVRLLRLLLGLQLLQNVCFPLLHFTTKVLARRGMTTCASVVAHKSRQDDPVEKATASDTVITIEANESTPLLVDQWRGRNYGGSNNNNNNNNNNTVAVKISHSPTKDQRVCDFRLIVFSVTLAAGLCIATYLLVIETRLPSLRFSLDLFNHDVWSRIGFPLGVLLNHSNVVNVMIMHTGGKNCGESNSCIEVLQEMQALEKSGVELPYNFLIGGDDLAYEVRGWDHESGLAILPQSTSLVYGFIGNYTNSSPSERQLHIAMSLIRESIRRRKLQRQYHIYGLRNLTISHWDAEALLKSLSQWPRFEAPLQVL